VATRALALDLPSFGVLIGRALVEAGPIRLGLVKRTAVGSLSFRKRSFAPALTLFVSLAQVPVGLGFLPRGRVLSGLAGSVGTAWTTLAALARILRPRRGFRPAALTAPAAAASPPIAPAFGAASSLTLGLLAVGFLIASFV
jgi:hypothetical protein